LSFEPRGLGFGLGTKVSVTLPRAVHVVGQSGKALTRTLEWEVPGGSTLRLQQLLAQLGYLPVHWQPSGAATAPRPCGGPPGWVAAPPAPSGRRSGSSSPQRSTRRRASSRGAMPIRPTSSSGRGTPASATRAPAAR